MYPKWEKTKINLQLLFFEYREKFIENWGDYVTRMTITREKKSEI